MTRPALSVSRAGLAIALLGSAVAPAAISAQFPTTAPAPAPIKPAAFPPFEQATLPNGMRLLVVQNKKQPVASISLSFAAGTANDPAGKSGLADMVAGLLTKGAGKRSADEVSAAIEGVGGSIAANASPDFLTIGVDVLAGNAKLAFDLMADAVIRPAFPDKELDLLRTQTLSGLQLELSSPASIAARTFAKGLYGAHPYGRSSDAASVKAITRDDVLAFHKTWIRPSGAMLVVAGSLSLAEAQALATSAFGAWSGAPATAAARPAVPVRSSTEIVLVHKPGAVQSNILVGNLTWKPSDPRAYAATVADKVLGGGANARLFLILREQKSWTYGAYSALRRHRDMGNFEANTEVRTDVTDSALVELIAQLKRIGGEPIPAKEFTDAKNSLTGAFPLTVETAAQVAGQVSSAKALGLPPDYVATYRQKLAAVTVADAQAAAKAAIRPSQALIVVVGDGAKIYEKIKGIAPTKIVSVDGTPLTPADLTAKAAALDLAMDKIVARTDSFSIFVQGNPLGWQTSKLEKDGSNWTYTERVQLAAFVSQVTEVKFTDKFVTQSVHESGKQAGQDVKVDVVFTAGHAKGSAASPSPTGLKSTNIDADVPTGAIDDNLLSVILPALKWTAGAKFAVPVFASSKGTAMTIALAVSAEESVKVPAGTFDAYKVDVTGGESPLTVWVERGGEHRLLKIALVGQPVEFQLIK